MQSGKIIDLTLPYSNKIAGYQSKPAKTMEKDGWNAQTMEIYSHAGTHMDSPFHFGVSNQTIDDFAPDRFIVNCHLINVPVTTDSYLMEIEDLNISGLSIDPKDGIVLKTGWSKYLGEGRYRDGLPRISESLAKWIVDQKISFLGVEPPSVADVNNIQEVTRIHQILLGGDVIIVEGLTNLDQLSKQAFTIVSLPLKILGGDGAPARVIAIEE